jgi:HSP20 family protein
MANPIRRWSDTNRNPFRSLQRQMNNLFTDIWNPTDVFNSGDYFSGLGTNQMTNFIPAVDVEETDNEYRMTIDLPGLKKEDVRVEVQNNQLIVSGERRQEQDNERGRSHFRERSYGSFVRAMTLPSNLNPDTVEANFENGVLTLTIPKTEESRPRQIQINQGRGGSISQMRNPEQRNDQRNDFKGRSK